MHIMYIQCTGEKKKQETHTYNTTQQQQRAHTSMQSKTASAILRVHCVLLCLCDTAQIIFKKGKKNVAKESLARAVAGRELKE